MEKNACEHFKKIKLGPIFFFREKIFDFETNKKTWITFPRFSIFYFVIILYLS